MSSEHGAGNSGVQIAAELAATHAVHLAVGQRNRHVPQTVLGRDLFWLLSRAGMLTAEPGTRRAQRMQRAEVVIGQRKRGLSQLGVTSRERVTSATGNRVSFADGTHLDVAAVVWATGFRADHSIVRVPEALDGRGLIRQRAGIGAFPGLYTIGQSWQRNRGSALLGFVGDDAAHLAGHIAQGLSTAARPHTAAR